MSHTVKIITFFIIAILISAATISEKKDIEKICYGLAILLLADLLTFWS